jgi:hypothetical protein
VIVIGHGGINYLVVPRKAFFDLAHREIFENDRAGLINGGIPRRVVAGVDDDCFVRSLNVQDCWF